MLQLFCPHPQARSRASIFISSAILIATISATQVKAIEAGSISIEPAQPVSGGSAILTATVEGANTLQWHFRGAPIAGATSSTLTLPTVHRGQQGLYTVVATDIGGQSSTTGVSLAIAATQEPDNYIVDPTYTAKLERDGAGTH